MAHREDYQQQRPIHYATILPSNIPVNGHGSNESPVIRKPTELERAKALYVDFEDAFQDETTNHDYFGLQHRHTVPEQSQQNSSYQPTNFYLQSVETISEVKNTNFSPIIRCHASRENSRPSTPSDTPPYQPRNNHRTNPLPSLSQNRYSINSNGTENLEEDFVGLNVMESNDSDDLPVPFTPDDIRIKIKHYDSAPLESCQFKLILPQYFLVKYLGRTKCTQLWGSTAVRGPIDDMVQSARQLSSVNALPTLEACINLRGLTLTHRQSPTHSKHNSRSRSPERHQNGLIPLEYISYVMHDVKYSKVATCIILRQSKTSSPSKKANNEALTECYAFLFQSKEHAHRFALSLAEAFNTQKHSSKGSKHSNDDKKDGRSPQRQSKHRNGRHHEKMRGKYDDSYLRDSEV